jgi:putative hydrolase of the HAD superfamily
MLKWPDVVIFDVDDTIYDYERCHRIAMKRIKEVYTQHFQISNQEFDAAFQSSKEAVKRTLGNTGSSHSRLLYFQKMSEILGMGPQILKSLEFEHTYWREFLRNADLFEKVLELLELLRQNNIRINILTDLTSQIQFRKLIHFKIDEYVDAIVTSEESGIDKPDPKNYALLQQKNGNQDLHYWIIGDNVLKDIAGSKNIKSCDAILKSANRKSKNFENYSIAFEFDEYDQLIKKFIELKNE